MSKPNSRDLKGSLDLELERNERVRAAVAAYHELAEGEKALFRLAQHGEDEANEENSPSQLQTIVKNLMQSLLEDHPSLLTESDMANLMDRDHTQKILGLQLRRFPLLRRREEGRKGSDTDGRDRFYAKLYDSRFYLCSQWWKHHHIVNAKGLLRFVGEIVGRDPNHPGVSVLERHMKDLREYIDCNHSDLSELAEQA